MTLQQNLLERGLPRDGSTSSPCSILSLSKDQPNGKGEGAKEITMRLPKFEYLEPKSLKQASKALAIDPSGSVLLAGGTDLLVIESNISNATSAHSYRITPL
jgi:hypothetical protein